VTIGSVSGSKQASKSTHHHQSATRRVRVDARREVDARGFFTGIHRGGAPTNAMTRRETSRFDDFLFLFSKCKSLSLFAFA
jgi:hypothetical protein